MPILDQDLRKLIDDCVTLEVSAELQSSSMRVQQINDEMAAKGRTDHVERMAAMREEQIRAIPLLVWKIVHRILTMNGISYEDGLSDAFRPMKSQDR